MGNRLIKSLFRYFVIISFMLIAIPAISQNRNKITLKMDNTRLGLILDEIERQTDYLFLCDRISLSEKKTIRVENKSLDETLSILFKDTDIVWKVSEASVYLSHKNSKSAEKGSENIVGTVKDINGNPIIGAGVLVKGTTMGASTDLDGKFSISLTGDLPSDTVLEFSCLGYKTINLKTNGRHTFKVTLEDDSVIMEGTVVTALGIKRSEKALSYNVKEISSDLLVGNKDANFINSLNGKVAGLNINSSSSGVGGASKVVMRGQKSISQSSNALYVIDGVPMYTRAKEGSTEFASQGSSDPIADINPEDIESISVLTGAAAAALYGSDAANGAIVVTTKKGKEGKLQVNVSSSVEFFNPFVLPRFQNRYGTGDLNSSIGSDLRSWGKLMNKSNNPNYSPSKDYFQLGVMHTESISLSAGTKNNQTYISASSIGSKGIVPNNRYERKNLTFRNTTYFLNDKMHLDFGASYIQQKDRNMTNQGTYNNPLVGAYLFPRGGDWDAVRMYERYDVARKLSTQYWPIGDAGMTMQNPYWINYRNLRVNDKTRFMLNASLSYDILDWLNVAGRGRMDHSFTKYTEKFYATTFPQLTELSTNGLYGITSTKECQMYADFLVNINKRFGSDWTLQMNMGASITDMRSDAFKNRGPIADGVITAEKPGLANVFNVQNLSNSPKTTRLQEGWREQTQSLFASAEVGFKGAYYLTLTARNDWPSQLAGPHSNKKSFFYPSVGGSVVLSQLIPNMPKNLEYVKLRGSYASVGTAFARYIANPMYKWNPSGLSWNTQTQYPMYDLKPELTNSIEVGLSMRFLKWFNLEATYYRTNTLNQTFNPQISTGSGSSDIYIQSGDVLNQGCEVALGFNKTWKRFKWESDFAFSMNQNKIISLAKNVLNAATGERFSVEHLDMKGLGLAHFILREGGTLGDLYSLVDYNYDSNGRIVVNDDGSITPKIVTSVKDYVKLGSVLPKANLSWRNDFRWGNFSFGALVSARIGGVVYSSTQAVLDYYGVSEASALARDAGGVFINGQDLIDANRWYSSVGGSTPLPQEYTYSATNVRLQEASIGYTIPKKVLYNLFELNFSIVGRNLLMIYNKAPFDPESVATTGNYYQGIDHFMMPSLRNFGFNVRFSF
jgi:hypothetical protein